MHLFTTWLSHLYSRGIGCVKRGRGPTEAAYQRDPDFFAAPLLWIIIRFMLQFFENPVHTDGTELQLQICSCKLD